MRLSGVAPDDSLVEFIELRDHPYFVATQAHPEFKSRPDAPHPLFAGLVRAAVAHRKAATAGDRTTDQVSEPAGGR
jgi:CTP synthase